ncbi:High cysteine membrane protein Group 2 [Giardia duodenalis]|uniref:High cysteine membrane protein Group 2 n=1 Tax=Giardia intestinalis (strain ATCC 50803 / WB clone C6) TaxID=184922 RepID=A0A644F7Z1_GIAIC|nr:High cysteine membrane protein Group 2 [Giardia intestinalis]KAE8304745.1 High cysteine membrane protein Group 2 [Giardia intestinalis]
MYIFLGLVLSSIGLLCVDTDNGTPLFEDGIDSKNPRVEAPMLITCKSDANRRRCAFGMCLNLGPAELCLKCTPGLLLIDGACVEQDSHEVGSAGCEVDPDSYACLSCSSSGYHVYSGGCFSAASGVLELVEPSRDSTLTCEEVISFNMFHTAPGKCKQKHCNVDLGGNKYCSRCSVKSEYLVDGKCLSSTDNNACTSQDYPDGTCKLCGNGYFLYKGGCYSITHGAPGNLICKEVDTIPGVCKLCQDGFFRLPEPAANRQSCMLCNDTSEYEYDDLDSYYEVRTFAGVEGCAKCSFKEEVTILLNKPVCEACHPDYYLLSRGDSAMCLSSQECTSSHFRKTVDEVNLCIFCGDASRGGLDGCSRCTYTANTGAITCESCFLYYYKKVDNGVLSCVPLDECTAPYYPKDSEDPGDLWDKQCLLCSDTNNNGIQDCTACTYTSTGLKCTACSGTKRPNAAGSTCYDCNIANCEECSSDTVCSRCAAGYIISSSACVADPDPCSVAGCKTCVSGNRQLCLVCHDGFYKDGTTCRKCAAGCTVCSGAGAQCTSCEQDRFLLRSESSSSGSCVVACGDGHFEDTTLKVCTRCSDAHCKRCAGPGVCTRCQDDMYLKLTSSSIECVSSHHCYTGSFPQENPDTGNKCVPCGDNLVGISNCIECTLDGGLLSCLKCKSGSFLDLFRRTCITQCPQNSSPKEENRAMACMCEDSYAPSNDGTLCEPTKPCPQYQGCAMCDSLDRCVRCVDPLDNIQLDSTTCQRSCPSGAAVRRGKCHCMGGQVPSGNTCVDPPKKSVSKMSTGMIAGISVASVAIVAVIIGCLVWFLLRRKNSGSLNREPSLFRPLSS